VRGKKEKKRSSLSKIGKNWVQNMLCGIFEALRNFYQLFCGFFPLSPENTDYAADQKIISQFCLCTFLVLITLKNMEWANFIFPIQNYKASNFHFSNLKMWSQQSELIAFLFFQTTWSERSEQIAFLFFQTEWSERSEQIAFLFFQTKWSERSEQIAFLFFQTKWSERSERIYFFSLPNW